MASPLDLNALEAELQRELQKYDSEISSKTFSFSSPLLKHHRSMFLETPPTQGAPEGGGIGITITDSGNVVISPSKENNMSTLVDKENASAVQLDLALCENDDDDNANDEVFRFNLNLNHSRTPLAILEKKTAFDANIRNTKDKFQRQIQLATENAELKATIATLQAHISNSNIDNHNDANNKNDLLHAEKQSLLREVQLLKQQKKEIQVSLEAELSRSQSSRAQVARKNEKIEVLCKELKKELQGKYCAVKQRDAYKAAYEALKQKFSRS